VAFGRVTDFVVWHVGSHYWPVFNIADAALLIGVAALVLFSRSQKGMGYGNQI
jgi:signal peptidase II